MLGLESTVRGMMSKYDWERCERLYRALQSQNMHEGFAMFEMSEVDRQVHEQMVEWFPSDVTTILDVGCKDGYAAWFFAQHGYEVNAIDVMPQFVQATEARGIKCEVGDMHFMRFGDRSFDLVYTSHVFEHSVMPIFCLGEWARVSKKWLMVRFPRHPSYVRMTSHWSVVPRDVFEQWVSALGLTIERFEELEWHEDCYLLKKIAHWPELSKERLEEVMHLIRELHAKKGLRLQLDKTKSGAREYMSKYQNEDIVDGDENE